MARKQFDINDTVQITAKEHPNYGLYCVVLTVWTGTGSSETVSLLPVNKSTSDNPEDLIYVKAKQIERIAGVR